MIQKHSTGVARAVRKSLVSIAVSEAGDNKWAVCPPGFHAFRFNPHAAAARHVVAGGIGAAASPRREVQGHIVRMVIGRRQPARVLAFGN